MMAVGETSCASQKEMQSRQLTLSLPASNVDRRNLKLRIRETLKSSNPQASEGDQSQVDRLGTLFERTLRYLGLAAHECADCLAS